MMPFQLNENESCSHNESAVNPTVDSERPWEQSPMLHPQPLLHGVPGVLGRHPGHVRGLGGLQVIRCTRRKRETITCSEDCTGFMTMESRAVSSCHFHQREKKHSLPQSVLGVYGSVSAGIQELVSPLQAYKMLLWKSLFSLLSE
nr:uncharacterized protein LOC105759165 isoform X5 [Taeniopygia guttata]